MDLQSLFYILAIAFMIMGILAEIAVIGVALAAYGQVKKLRQEMSEKMQIIDQIRRDPLLIARTAALKAGHSFFSRVSDMLAGT